MSTPESNQSQKITRSPVAWLAHQGSSLGPHLTSIEDALVLGARHPRSCLTELTEDQAETVRRLALTSLLTLRQTAKEDSR